MTLKDSFSLAYRTVRSNRLRTGITVAIIAFGIMALIGIITAIDAMNGSLRESFSTMGANGFTISYKERFRFGNDNQTEKVEKGKKQKKSNLDKPIQLTEAELFKSAFNFPAVVSVALSGPGSTELRYKSKKTNPNVRVSGGDENYLPVNGFAVEYGRNLNRLDVQTGRNVCLLGSDVAKKLFGETGKEKGVDKIVSVAGVPYRVIGILKSKGSSALMRADNVVITSYNNVRRMGNSSPSFTIGVMANDVGLLDGAVAEATSIFRGIRRLTPGEDENFVAEKSDKLAETFIGLLGSIQGAAGAIGLITLIGAAIGLMNIMLVAVNERTREVGLIKALGGKRRNIRQQFLFESTIISLLGAFFGILFGVLLGNVASLIFGTGFVVPWAWVIAGVLICSVVGLLAGLWPAIKASKLSPIIALRYE
ncbi:ABC transporter permease [Panacibacter sp. DH6]|uniref:ABC transporter permease n=1 Tax=Panacibacter microcysteis TaxID=2793269 RepID=A0A931GXU2_9BACT|nr:ABC transporter permease [Panacibacter microcysteis]MBG9376604.1 ABC transporter permease [Panacibacter microcysteis]